MLPALSDFNQTVRPGCVARIEAPHFVAGVVLQAGRVVRTAPILHYMRGWPMDRVRAYCRQRRWKLDELKPAVDS